VAETLIPQGVSVNPVNGLRARLGHNVETLAGSKTLTPQDATFQLLDCDGSGRDVNLPAEEASQGLFFVIKNVTAATHAITVKDDSGVSTIDSISAVSFGIFVCDGSSWVSAVGDVDFG
jgi:hypothetical protein